MIFACWYSIVVPLSGVMIIGFLSGILGTFAFLKKQTMLGDVIAHAALPGIVGAFMVTCSSSLSVLITGGFIAGLCAVTLITLLSQRTLLSLDALFGIILSVFFGAGLVLLTQVQKLPLSSQSVLNKFLFGSAVTLVLSDLYFLMVLAVVVCAILMLFWKGSVMAIFDPDYARTLGMPVTMIYILLHVLTVAVIVAGLYAVGVVLMSSLLVAPAVMARSVTRSVTSMACIAAAWGMISCMSGMMVSALVPHMPTGASIVVVATLGAWAALLVRKAREHNT